MSTTVAWLLTTGEDADVADALSVALGRVRGPGRAGISVSAFAAGAGGAADHLVVVLSPAAVADPDHAARLADWVQRHGTDRLLPVVRGGTWQWDPAVGRLAAHATAAPPLLRERFTVEPRHLDLTWADPAAPNAPGSSTGLRRDARIAEAAAELAAPILGVTKEDLFGAELKRHRRVVAVVRSALAVLAVLALVAVAASVVARGEARDAEAARSTGVVGRIAAQARNVALTRPDVAMLLATEAWRRAPGPDGYSALLAAANEVGRQDPAVWDLPAVRAVASDPSGTRVAVEPVDGPMVVVDLSQAPSGDTPARASVRTLEGTDGIDGSMSFDTSGRLWIWDDTRSRFRIWSPDLADVRDGVVLDRPEDHDARVVGDGALLLSGGSDGVLRVLDIDTGRQLGELDGHDGAISDVDATADGRLVASIGRDGRLVVSDLSADPVTSAAVEVVPEGTGLQAVAWSNDGTRLAVLDGLGTLHGFDASLEPTGSADLSVVGGVPTQLGRFGADRFLVAGSLGRLQIVDADMAVRFRDEVAARGTSFVLSAERGGEQVVVVGSEGSVGLFTPFAPEVMGTVDTGSGQSITGRRVVGGSVALGVAFGGTSDGADWELGTWDATDGTRSDLVPIDLDYVRDVELAGDGSWVAAVGRTGSGADVDLVLVDLATGEVAAELRADPEWGEIRSIAALGDRGVVLATRTSLVLVPIGAGRGADAVGAPVVVERAPGEVEFQVVAADATGTRAAVARSDGTVTVHEGARLERRTREVTGQAPSSALAFDPAGERLAIAGDGTIRVIAPDGSLGPVLVDTQGGLPVTMAFLPDGRHLVSGSSSGTLGVWDLATDREVGSGLWSYSQYFQSLAVDPDTGRVVTASRLARIVTWELDPDRLADALCDLAGRSMTRAEWDTYLPDESYAPSCTP